MTEAGLRKVALYLEYIAFVIRMDIGDYAKTIETSDWRIGLCVKRKGSKQNSPKDEGAVADVMPSGHVGITDKDGVLIIRLDTGTMIVEPASNWKTH